MVCGHALGSITSCILCAGPDLERRLAAHCSSVDRIVGADGWLAKLDEPVATRLTAHERGYDGREVLELVRAIRNVQEHWFERERDEQAEAQRQAVVAMLTGWTGEEMRKGTCVSMMGMHAGLCMCIIAGDASKRGQAMQAEAVARYFVTDRFPELLLVLEFGREWAAVGRD